MDMDRIREAADLIRQADGLLITAGAGMGVDSGLPDFRGNRGFWRAYPALGRQQIGFQEMAMPSSFASRQRLAWGFYGHRLNLYRNAVPHAGFQILLDLARHLPHGAFVYTSNVDGQFQKAGFAESQVVECHGSIHYLQCLETCSMHIWPADSFHPDVDEDACLLRSPLPECPRCRAVARPNILMFDDWSWIASRTEMQDIQFDLWRKKVGRMVVIELGAGVNLPTIRRKGEAMKVPMIRINPTDERVPGARSIGLRMGALEALTKIAEAFGK